AITQLPVSSTIAMTGEVSIRGLVRPVGGVVAKIEAALHAGVKEAFVPKDNWQELFAGLEAKGLKVRPVERIEEVIRAAIPASASGDRRESSPGSVAQQQRETAALAI